MGDQSTTVFWCCGMAVGGEPRRVFNGYFKRASLPSELPTRAGPTERRAASSTAGRGATKWKPQLRVPHYSDFLPRAPFVSFAAKNWDGRRPPQQGAHPLRRSPAPQHKTDSTTQRNTAAFLWLNSTVNMRWVQRTPGATAPRRNCRASVGCALPRPARWAAAVALGGSARCLPPLKSVLFCVAGLASGRFAGRPAPRSR